MINESEVYRWFDIFKGNNQLTEIRIIGNNQTFSGYFKDAKTLVEAIKPYDGYNIYFSINRIDETCYGREQCNKIIRKPKNTTTDAEIIGRDFVYLDLDSKKISGVNATDDEVEKTKAKAREVYKFLKDNGFNEPIVVFSGNGVHFYLRCALLPSEENNLIIKRFTQAMGMLFSDDSVDIDQKIFNLGRISKVPGTYSRKGSTDSADRPQRLCYIVKAPDEIKVNDIEYFKKIAALYPEDEVKPTYQNNYSTESFDLDAFIEKHNIPVTHKLQVSDGTRYYLKHCLFNEQHQGKDAILFKRNNGAVSYFCYHNSCANNDWQKVRLMYEPDAYTKRNNAPTQRQFQKPIEPFTPQEESEDKGRKWLSMKDIKRVDITELLSIPTGYEALDKKIVGLFAGELTVMSGLNASGKTSWLDCLALNVIQQGFKVGIWSGEMQDWRFQGWINQIAAGKTYVKKKQGYENLYYVPSSYSERIEGWLDNKLFLYNNAYGARWQQLFNDIKELVEEQKVQLIILDNLAALSISDYDGEKYSRQTKFILDVKDYAKQKNIHIILVCHPRKENFFLRKESISGTADLTNIADNVFLLHRVGKDFETRAGEFFGKDKALEYMQFGNVLEVAKNRQFGVVDHLVGMYFEMESRRLKNSVAEHIIYGWQEQGVQDELPQATHNNSVDIVPNTSFEEEYTNIDVAFSGESPF